MHLSYELAQWLESKSDIQFLPWQIDLDLTNVCNQDCFYCNTSSFRAEKPVTKTFEEYSTLISQLERWNNSGDIKRGRLQNIIISGGGEPTIFPKYDRLVEQIIDAGFIPAMNTNGTKLDRILSVSPEKLKRFAYIGLDIDSGVPETYELIRRSKSKISPYTKVKNTASKLCSYGIPVDIKALLNEHNTSELEIESLFAYAKEVGARSVHLRPVVIENKVFTLSPEVIQCIDKNSAKYSVPVSLSLGRFEARDYKKCHQVFLFPSFCADGNIYLCCEYKGRPDLVLGKWTDSNWQDMWCSEKHKEIYQRFNAALCKPCRPNWINNEIQHEITVHKNYLI